MNNPPAFPNDRRFDDAYAELRGMTLRDYFAAAAMQGLSASSEFSDETYVKLAEYSYAQADAMLAAREKTR